MKQIVPFKKELPFKTKVSEITSISLEREINKVIRKSIIELIKSKKESIKISSNNLEKYLGPIIYEFENKENSNKICKTEKLNFITISMLNNTIYKNINKIPKDVDLIVGIPRSGLLVANLLALYLNIKLTDIETQQIIN